MVAQASLRLILPSLHLGRQHVASVARSGPPPVIVPARISPHLFQSWTLIQLSPVPMNHRSLRPPPRASSDPKYLDMPNWRMMATALLPARLFLSSRKVPPEGPIRWLLHRSHPLQARSCQLEHTLSVRSNLKNEKRWEI